MRQLLEAPLEDGGLLRELDSELAEDRIYVLTPRGEVVDLPQGATPLDFAYRVHTVVGHRCRGAKVDGRIVPLDHVLRRWFAFLSERGCLPAAAGKLSAATSPGA